jgi:PAS domain S-box-containing protein
MPERRRPSLQELRAETERLRGELARYAAIAEVVHDLEVHKEEVQTQAERLVETQRELEASRDRYAELYDFAPIAYMTFDPNGVVLEINLTGVALLGRPRAAIEGFPFRVFVDAPDRPRFRDHLRRVRVEPQEVTTELHVLTTAGPRKAVELRTARFHDRMRDAAVYRTVVIDLTARHEAERLAIAAEAERQRSEREEAALRAANEEKDRFIATLSHELRTPLTPVLLTLTAIEQRSDAPDWLAPMLERVRRNVEIETRLIDDLLDVTRIASGKLVLADELVDVHRALVDVVDMCAPHKDPTVELGLELEAEHHHVRGDGARVRQVFWNLLRNAVQVTPAEGSVRLRSWNEGQGRLHVAVEDTGIGLEPSEMERVFQPFFQGRERSGRLGLGLAICQAVVRAHGGSIAASSSGRGHGARFEVALGTAPQPTASQPAGTSPPSSGRRAPILLVEDHPDTAETVSEALQLLGYPVRVAGTMADALAVPPPEYEIVISDIGLPDGTGHELMRRLRSCKPVRGIALSGFGRSSDVEKSRAAGFDTHLTKPVSLDTLVRAIDDLVGRGTGSAA